MKSRFILLALVALFLGHFMHAQLPYRVTNGEDLNIEPIATMENAERLKAFFESESEFWVHHHPNGADFVVTPKNWEESPNSTRQKIIHEAIQVMTKARQVYAIFGNLSTNLYYILDDTERVHPGEAFWIVNKSCWMVSGVPNVRALSPQQRMQIYAHEIGHCLIMENLQDYSARYSMNNWFDESVAEYLSSQVYPAANYEHGHSFQFVFADPFRQRYSAYPIWKRYVEQHGASALFPMMQSLVDGPTLQARRRVMRNTDFDMLIHNFYYDFLRLKIMDEAGGAIPANYTTLRPSTIRLRPDLNELSIGELHMDRLNGFNLVIPSGFDLNISPLEGAGDTVFQSLLKASEYQLRNWISEKTILGDCEEDVTVLATAFHLNDNPISDLKFQYTLTEKEKEECCDEMIVGDCDDCLAPYDAHSEIPSNPVENIDGNFSFDYKIEAVVRFEMNMSSVNTEYFRGIPNELVMEYYVNSTDGSILFPGGSMGFFSTNFRGDLSDIHAAIWLANGQMVGYGTDRTGTKKAITRKINRTAGQRIGMDHQYIMDFFSSSDALAEHPQPMPESVRWEGITKGYKGNVIEQRTGIENTVNLYFSVEPTPIRTSCNMMGFMVGVLKDTWIEKCNRLLVYNKVFIGGEDSGDSMEAELRSIKLMGMNFDGREYDPMYVGGEIGTDINAKMQEYNTRLQILEMDKENFKNRKKLCRDQVCRDEMNREIERLDERIERLNCEAARALGWEHLADNCD